MIAAGWLEQKASATFNAYLLPVFFPEAPWVNHLSSGYDLSFRKDLTDVVVWLYSIHKNVRTQATNVRIFTDYLVQTIQDWINDTQPRCKLSKQRSVQTSWKCMWPAKLLVWNITKPCSGIRKHHVFATFCPKILRCSSRKILYIYIYHTHIYISTYWQPQHIAIKVVKCWSNKN